MKSNYLAQLDRELRDLVLSIERYISSEIQVTIESEGRNKLECDIDNNGATIIIPSADYFPESSVYHELLHIRRLTIDGVPRIILCEDYPDVDPEYTLKLQKKLHELDQLVEHFVIIPEECKKYPDRKFYWKKKIKSRMDKVYNASNSDGRKAVNALFDWAFVTYVIEDSDLMVKAKSIVDELGVEAQAVPFLDDIVKHIDNIKELFNAFVKHLKFKDGIVCFEYLY